MDEDATVNQGKRISKHLQESDDVGVDPTGAFELASG